MIWRLGYLESDDTEGFDHETPFFQNSIDPESEIDLVQASTSMALKKIRRNGKWRTLADRQNYHRINEKCMELVCRESFRTNFEAG